MIELTVCTRRFLTVGLWIESRGAWREIDGSGVVESVDPLTRFDIDSEFSDTLIAKQIFMSDKVEP